MDCYKCPYYGNKGCVNKECKKSDVCCFDCKIVTCAVNQDIKISGAVEYESDKV